MDEVAKNCTIALFHEQCIIQKYTKNPRYGLLDVEQSYLCAEGWHGPSVEKAILFHFWTSDFDHKNKRRDGSPIRMKKKHYFDLFYPTEGGARDEAEVVSLLEDLRYQLQENSSTTSTLGVGTVQPAA